MKKKTYITIAVTPNPLILNKSVSKSLLIMARPFTGPVFNRTFLPGHEDKAKFPIIPGIFFGLMIVFLLLVMDSLELLFTDDDDDNNNASNEGVVWESNGVEFDADFFFISLSPNEEEEDEEGDDEDEEIGT